MKSTGSLTPIMMLLYIPANWTTLCKSILKEASLPLKLSDNLLRIRAYS